MNYYTNPVNNYPGIKPLKTGVDILNKMKSELAENVTQFYGNVNKVEGKCPEFRIQIRVLNTPGEKKILNIKSKTLLFATGTSRKHPKINGRSEKISSWIIRF